jgi:hypothetical protein
MAEELNPAAERKGANIAKQLDYQQEEPGTAPSWKAWFGGRSVVVGPRIVPVAEHVRDGSDSDETTSDILGKQLAEEDGHAIQYRTCSWQKVPILLNSPNVGFQAANAIA